MFVDDEEGSLLAFAFDQPAHVEDVLKYWLADWTVRDGRKSCSRAMMALSKQSAVLFSAFPFQHFLWKKFKKLNIKYFH